MLRVGVTPLKKRQITCPARVRREEPHPLRQPSLDGRAGPFNCQFLICNRRKPHIPRLNLAVSNNIATVWQMLAGYQTHHRLFQVRTGYHPLIHLRNQIYCPAYPRYDAKITSNFSSFSAITWRLKCCSR